MQENGGCHSYDTPYIGYTNNAEQVPPVAWLAFVTLVYVWFFLSVYLKKCSQGKHYVLKFYFFTFLNCFNFDVTLKWYFVFVLITPAPHISQSFQVLRPRSKYYMECVCGHSHHPSHTGCTKKRRLPELPHTCFCPCQGSNQHQPRVTSHK